MALIPLNTFKTKTTKLTSATAYTNYTAGMQTSTVYTAPIGVTAIILMAQVANLSTLTQTCSFVHHRNRPVLRDAQGNGGQDGNVDSYLVKNFEIPGGDAATVLTGKLILEQLDSVRAYNLSSSTQSLQLVLSVLETANS
jgi:hypothetical protein